ncbi:MAG: hypothetical protein EP343_33865 [Deltaproteobacteria bacterium]|nr:MAG: hypothetical protein EP343_33865 [Deltaproteobacteria bacterium]
MPTLTSNEAWEEELQRFVEFGVLLNRKMRVYLVAYLQHKLGLEHEPPMPIFDTYLDYFTQALDGIFGDELVEMLQDKEVLARQVAVETLKWLRKTHQKVQSEHPYGTEKDRLEMWSITPMFRFVERWPHLTTFLNDNYGRHELDASFYKVQFKDLIQEKPLNEIPEESQKRIDLLWNDLLAQWDALLHAKILHYQLNVLEDEQQTFQETLESRIEEYQKFSSLIGPFAEYLGRYWDSSREPLSETNFDVLEQYEEFLRQEDSVRELADLLGRMRQAEIELEEEVYENVIVSHYWEERTHAKGPFEGVHHSNDLSVMLSSEAALLSDSATENLFLAKYADQQLLTLRYDNRERVTSKHHFSETHERVKRKEKGPFIICVDTSDSMYGTPEHIAKVLCFALLKMAAKDNRRAYLINFSVGVRTIDLYDIANSLDEIVSFLQMSFYGGTSITLPMYEVLRQLETESYRDADVLVISDFIMYRVEEDILRSIRYFQENQGTQFHCLTLSSQPLESFVEVFDTNWIYDPEDKGIIRELASDMATVRARMRM